MDEITPLFIFGMGRSGTTNALRVLNAHPTIALNGEISLSVMKQYFALLDTTDRSYAEKDAVREGWHARKAQYMFESFGYLSKGGRGPLRKLPAARFRGHKTPRHESLFDDYERHFRSAALKPRYFYCTRNAFDCWRSYRTMAWNGYRDAAAFLDHYMESHRQLDHMRQHAGERAFVLNLDELIRAPDPVAYYRARIFDPLGLDLPESALRRIARESGAHDRNAAPLSEAEIAVIGRHPGNAALHETMFAPFAHAALALP